MWGMLVNVVTAVLLACLSDRVVLAKFDSDVVRGQSHDEFIIWIIKTIAWSRCARH